MFHVEPGRVSALFGLLDGLFRRAHRFAFANEGGGRLVRLGNELGQRMLGRDAHEARAEKRVGPGRVDLEHVAEIAGRFRHLEANERALAAADPVALHGAHLVRPIVERIERIEQVLRVVGDLEDVLRQFALLDDGAGAPAAPIDDLLVGQHRVVDRVPVDARGAPLDEAGLQHVEEEGLLLRVIFGIAGRELARPVEREPHRLELAPHDGDIVIGPLARVNAAGHRGVLRRQAEGVPAHRVQHVEAPGPLVARHHVAHRVVARVADMDAARRVGKHLQHVIGRTPVALDGEGAGRVPRFLPAHLDGLGLVADAGGVGGVAVGVSAGIASVWAGLGSHAVVS